jgi:transcriptional regulator with XRE-family HTH domain
VSKRIKSKRNRERVESRGRDALQRRIADGYTQDEVAALIDVPQSNISNWCTGWLRPSPLHRALLEIVLGIPAEWWMTQKERELIKEMQERVAAAPPRVAATRRAAA